MRLDCMCGLGIPLTNWPVLVLTQGTYARTYLWKCMKTLGILFVYLMETHWMAEYVDEARAYLQFGHVLEVKLVLEWGQRVHVWWLWCQDPVDLRCMICAQAGSLRVSSMNHLGVWCGYKSCTAPWPTPLFQSQPFDSYQLCFKLFGCIFIFISLFSFDCMCPYNVAILYKDLPVSFQ